MFLSCPKFLSYLLTFIWKKKKALSTKIEQFMSEDISLCFLTLEMF